MANLGPKRRFCTSWPVRSVPLKRPGFSAGDWKTLGGCQEVARRLLTGAFVRIVRIPTWITVRPIRTRQPLGNLLATSRKPTGVFLEKPERPNGWNCPDVFGKAARGKGSPCLCPAVCRRRACPICGPFWHVQTMHRFATHIDAHPGQLYYTVLDDLDWPTVAKFLRRQAKASGEILGYVSVRDVGERLHVFSTVPLDNEGPISKENAVFLLDGIFSSASPGPRPFTASRSWGKLADDETADDPVTAVPGGCSPRAYRATLQSWGTEPAKATGSVLRPKRDGLFFSPMEVLTARRKSTFGENARFSTTAAPKRRRSFTAF